MKRALYSFVLLTLVACQEKPITAWDNEDLKGKVKWVQMHTSKDYFNLIDYYENLVLTSEIEFTEDGNYKSHFEPPHNHYSYKFSNDSVRTILLNGEPLWIVTEGGKGYEVRQAKSAIADTIVIGSVWKNNRLAEDWVKVGGSFYAHKSYTRDSEDLVSCDKKEKWIIADGFMHTSGDSLSSKLVYEITKRDDHGNWIERNIKINYVIREIEYRRIQYYE